MSKRAFITGITGMVGSHLADYLLQHTDWDIYGLIRWRSPLDNLQDIVHRINRGERVFLLYGDLRDAVSLQRAIGAVLVGRIRGGEREFGGLDGPCVERPARFYRGVEGLRDLSSSEFAAAESIAELGDCLAGEIGHYSITFGTAKKPCCASGAFLRMSSRQLPSLTTSPRRRR